MELCSILIGMYAKEVDCCIIVILFEHIIGSIASYAVPEGNRVVVTYRKKEIDERLAWLETADMRQVLTMLSDVYRENYRCRCVSMSWVHPLHVLQVRCCCYC